MSEPWLDYQQEEAPPWADYAKPKPKQSASDLYKKAMQGDRDALETYNTRARTYGQNTIEQDIEQNSPVAGQNFAQNAWQGVGKFWPNLARNFDSPEEVSRARELDKPLMDTWGGIVGTVASNAAMVAGPQSALTRGLSVAGNAAPYLASSGVGAAAGAADPVGVGETRGNNAGRAAIWGLGGQAAGDLIGAGARAFIPSMTKESSELLDSAYSMGVRPDAGQVSKNPMIRQIVNQLSRMPLSGAGSRSEANQVAFNRVVSETYGVPADKITSEVHSKAVNALSDEFNRLKAATQIPVAPTFLSSVKGARSQIRDKFGAEAAKSYDYWAQNLLNRSKNGVISGPDYQAWSSELADDLGKMSGDRKAGAGELAKLIEKSAADGLSPADKRSWARVRQQWAVMKQVEPLVAKSISGDIPPAQLLNRVTADEAGKVRVARGKGGTLADAARVGQQFLKEPADSGTAARSGVINAMQRVLQNPVAQTGLLAGGAYTADKYNVATPGQIGVLGALLLANRYGLKAAASPSVIRGVPQKAIESTAKKVLPRVAIPYALSSSASAEEKKKQAKKP